MNNIFSAKTLLALSSRITSKTAVSLAATVALTLAASQSASAAVMTFGQTTAGDNFSQYVEDGFTADVVSGSWFVSGYGNPGQSVQFFHEKDQAPTAHTLKVANSGSLFNFSSVDLYSSVTVIPYSITGFRNNSQVFSISGVVPNTFGSFKTVANTYAGLQIDSLQISLTNPELGFGRNPIGLDNIVTAPVPEPETYGMMLAGLLTLAALRRRKAAP